MRILWLKSDLLLPLDKGGKLRTWHLLRHLARQHDVTYLAFSDDRRDADALAGMHAVANSVETIVRRETPKGSMRFYFDVAAHLFDPLPYAVGSYRSREYRQRVMTLLRERRFDVVVCDFLCQTVNLPAAVPCPTVLFTHNVESEIWRRHAANKRRGWQRWLYELQYRRMLRCERRALERFDRVLAVSDADARTFMRLYPGAVRHPIHVVQTGVDTSYFRPSENAAVSPAAPPELVFTGSMDWLPNEDAMLYFVDRIWPRIRQARPDVRLSIVGRAPTAAVKRLADDLAIRVTGRVDDVRPFVDGAAVYIVPLRIGGGTRLKIFEAMAMGKAVVSTTVGAEGLPIEPGTHAVIADEPSDFAAAVVDLLRDDRRRAQLGAAARALVVEKFDWSSVATALDRALAEVANDRTTAPNPLAAGRSAFRNQRSAIQSGVS